MLFKVRRNATVKQRAFMRDLPNPTMPLSSLTPNSRRRLPRPETPLKPNLGVAWARDESELREAQRLRYHVFAEEMGASVKGPAGLDVDEYDQYCDHLIVRDQDSLKVVGTYRVLPPGQAKRLGRLYSEGEFDLSRLDHLRPKMLETGRSCVHAEYRNGAVIMALWSGLAEYMLRNGLETMLGCASVPMADGGHYAASLYRKLQDTAMAPAEYQAVPRIALPVSELQSTLEVEPPALVKGYLRLGARICGAPAWDPDFNTADFLTLFRLSDINPRYARHFLGAELLNKLKQA
ncbi:hypothetical protein PanNE5_29300 [Pandoraea sp. NE5]|nr:hypothetical protein PanNE5_29300 [Pandoraea sp. NE5]